MITTVQNQKGEENETDFIQKIQTKTRNQQKLITLYHMRKILILKQTINWKILFILHTEMILLKKKQMFTKNEKNLNSGCRFRNQH